MKALHALVKLINLPTPKVGKSLRNIGLKLIGAGSAGLVTTTALPEVPDSWLQFLRLAVEVLSALSILVGTLMTGAGQAQVKGDPDHIV